MNRLVLVAVATIVCVGVLTGCHGGVETDILERELRHQEDHIYNLKDELDHYAALLESCRRENLALKRQLGMSPGEESDEVEELDIEVDIPNMSSLIPEGRIQSFEQVETPLSDTTEPTTFGPLEKIELNPLLSGGLNVDGRPGDEGMLAVVQPRDAAGNLLREPGRLSLMVRDSTKTGRAAQLVRWDFERAELPLYWHKTPMAEGYVFELPWPVSAPQGEALQLWVRLITDDGKKYLARLDIDVEPGGATEPPSATFARRRGWTRRRVSNVAPATLTEQQTHPPRLSQIPEAKPRQIKTPGGTHGASSPAEQPIEMPTTQPPDGNSAAARKRPEWAPDR